MMLHINGCLPKSHPLNIHDIGSVKFPHPAVGIHNFPTADGKIAECRIIVHIGCPGIKLIEKSGKKNFKFRILPFRSSCEDDIITLFRFLIQMNDLLRIILQITVHDNCPVSGAVVQPRKNRLDLSEISGHIDSDNMLISAADIADPFPGIFRAVIIHHDNFIIITGQLCKRLGQSSVQLRDCFRTAIHRNYN